MKNKVHITRDFAYQRDWNDDMIVRIVVEQPAGERFRMKYKNISLIHAKGFKGVYGWVDGYGHPPQPHKDVFLLTDTVYSIGQIVEGRIVGCFIRNDGDNKIICIEPNRFEVDIEQLRLDEVSMIKNLYPRVAESEGWFGKEKAISLLDNDIK